MRLSATLTRYLARNYFFNLVFMICLLWSVVYLFDTVELLRRASKREDIPLSLVLQMGLLKLPEVGMMIFPFAVLFSAMFTFWQLNRRHELIVVRSAGFSVWQFLTPVLGVAVLTGVLTVTVLNPVAAALLGKFRAMESTLLTNRSSHVALFDEGLWLRQLYDDGYVILHAGNVKMPEWQLQNVMVLFFNDDDSFVRRLDAPMALLDNGMWLFKNAYINEPHKSVDTIPLVALPTELTIQEIEESFASPETLSFWNLPAFIKLLESTGFSSTRLKIHFQTLLSQPLLFASMILLAAAVSLRPPRFRGTLILIIAGIVIGFVTFFTANFLQALGASHQIPVFLAAWSPALIMFLLGMAAMLNMEDG